MVEPGEISAFSVTQLNALHERLRILLGILGEEYALQVQWSIDSDYRHELERYHRETLDLRRQDPVHGQFGVLIRAERYEAELHRLRGVFLAAVGADETQIEASFCAAINTAREQKSVSLEKRAEGTYAEYCRQKVSGSRGRGFRLPIC